jgi:hypothetical protein
MTIATNNTRKVRVNAATLKAAKAKNVAAKARQRALDKVEPLGLTASKLDQQLHVYRADAVSGALRHQGGTRLYAAALLREFGQGFWVISSQKGKLSDNETTLRKNVRAEQRACRELASSRGLSNVYKPWSDALALLKNPEGKTRVAAAKRPAPERINAAILEAFKVAHTNYEEFENDAAYVAVYEALEALCNQRKIDTKAITDKQ